MREAFERRYADLKILNDQLQQERNVILIQLTQFQLWYMSVLIFTIHMYCIHPLFISYIIPNHQMHILCIYALEEQTFVITISQGLLHFYVQYNTCNSGNRVVLGMRLLYSYYSSK